MTKDSDALVARLRARQESRQEIDCLEWVPDALCNKAADTIERQAVEIERLRERGSEQYGDPPFDRPFLAKAVTYGFDHETREWGPCGRRWVEASWQDGAYRISSGDARSATAEMLEIMAWAECPGSQTKETSHDR